MRYLFAVFISIIAFNSVYAQEFDEKELVVRNYGIKSGFAARLSMPEMAKILELGKEQSDEIERVCKDMEKEASLIKQDKSRNNEEKLTELKEINRKLDERLREVLLPHQNRVLESLPYRRVIFEEGLATSLNRGLLADNLKLSTAEREKVEKAAKAAFEQYEKAVIAAQKKALRDLRSSLPENKRADYDKLLEPLLSHEGTIWKPDSSLIDVSRQLPPSRYLIPARSGKK